MSEFSSSIRLDLPLSPATKNTELYKELVPLYAAIQTLSIELSAAKDRIKALETYNNAHP